MINTVMTLDPGNQHGGMGLLRISDMRRLVLIERRGTWFFLKLDSDMAVS